MLVGEAIYYWDRYARVVLALVVIKCGVASGALLVDGPLPIEHRLTVQLIQTAHDSGSPVATAFGDAEQRAAIESRIDSIWAQAGIDIYFVPEINRLNSTYAYDEAPSLSAIISTAGEAGVLSPDPLTLNLVFVNQVPGFSSHVSGSSAGRAYFPGNGIAQFVGANLLTFSGGLDVIARVAAHEIGHNLGLDHTPSEGDDLMRSPSTGSGARLTASQISRASLLATYATWPRSPVTSIATAWLTPPTTRLAQRPGNEVRPVALRPLAGQLRAKPGECGPREPGPREPGRYRGRCPGAGSASTTAASGLVWHG